MTRTTIAAVTAVVLMAGAAAPARADGWSIGLSIGTAFRIGDCGWGSISVGIPIGGYRHRYYDRYDYCDTWPYYRTPRVCSPAYYRPVYERPYSSYDRVETVHASADESAPARVAPAPARRVETEADAWTALGANDPAAMAMFGRLVAQSRTAGTPEIGYAICAAQAGQLDRAEWAAGLAMRASPDVWTKIPQDEAVKSAAAAALAMVHDDARHGQLAATLRKVAADAPASTSAIPTPAEGQVASNK